ncbi:2-oxoglutarate-dependent dioxygenase DAO-like [Prosopis cineraria]|uniref:2-oxoglutarate-dependent dioxygenase DAO-like n=1 Tax=Prosopis cineraria TaxID=364024 RepID=UPI00240FED27|nr:2-oxoglutarate-dependent dioxygenase DAO-like [Prosopis cineraria]
MVSSDPFHPPPTISGRENSLGQETKKNKKERQKERRAMAVICWNNIPEIDLQESADNNNNRQELKKKLREACQEWGCFRVKNHGIDSSLMGEMKKVVRSLLDLPLEIKMRNTDVIAGSGYMPPSSANPLYEGLGLYDMASSQAVQGFCSHLNASPHQRKVLETYGKAVHELLMDISKKMAESLGLKEGIVYFKKWPCQFRINKYSFTSETVGSSGVQIHTDCAFLTILQDDENVGGLQVMNNKSGSFVDVPPCTGSFFAILGDIAHVWSNGRFMYAKHRVECKEASVRVSIASFLLGPKEEVRAPEDLVDSDGHRLFLPFAYEHYKKLRLSNNMRAGEALALLHTHSKLQS